MVQKPISEGGCRLSYVRYGIIVAIATLSLTSFSATCQLLLGDNTKSSVFLQPFSVARVVRLRIPPELQSVKLGETRGEERSGGDSPLLSSPLPKSHNEKIVSYTLAEFEHAGLLLPAEVLRYVKPGEDVVPELLSRRVSATDVPGLGWRQQPEQHSLWMPHALDPDIVLIEPGEGDGMDGVEVVPPAIMPEPSGSTHADGRTSVHGYSADTTPHHTTSDAAAFDTIGDAMSNADVYRQPDMGIAEARARHEHSSLLSLVLPSAPRSPSPPRSSLLPSYFHLAGQCPPSLCYKTMPLARAQSQAQSEPIAESGSLPLPLPVPQAILATTGVAERLRAMGAQCDADAKCAGFSFDGCFYSAISPFQCPGVEVESAEIAENAGVFSKTPALFLQAPRWVDIFTNSTSEIDPQWLDIDPTAAEPLPPGHTRFWVVPRGDIYQHDIGEASPAPPEVDKLQHIAMQCVGLADCTGFHFPTGWMKHSADITLMVVPSPSMGELYSRVPYPPVDYLTATLIGLLRELSGIGWSNATTPDSELTCWARKRVHQASDRSFRSATGANILDEPAFDGYVHIYIADTSAVAFHEYPGGGSDYDRHHSGGSEQRMQHMDDYWYTAFAYLRRRFGHLPCLTFLSANSYARLREVRPPLSGRGNTQWHPDNYGKRMARGIVSQTLDFVSALRHAAAFSPIAHLMLWEDDSHACPGVFSFLSHAVATAHSLDPRWGGMRVGNGGSGMLFRRELVKDLLLYLVTRRGSENIDVSMWRFLQSGGYADYISTHSWAAHRGIMSSFRKGTTNKGWNRVECTNRLDRHWGYYKPCNVTLMRSASMTAPVDTSVALPPWLYSEPGSPWPANPASESDLPSIYNYTDFSRDWECSVYSRATDGQYFKPSPKTDAPPVEPPKIGPPTTAELKADVQK